LIFSYENEDKDINIDLTKKENQNFKISKPIQKPFTFSEFINEIKIESRSKN
jgi:hypothetical protein